MAELFETIKTRSSIRAYKPEALKEEEIQALVEAALLAPTARNEQEIHVSVVSTANPIVDEMQNDLSPNAAMKFHYGAPTLIVLSGADDFGWSAVDAGISVQNIHLAAKGMGLGSVIIGCIKGVLTGEKKAYYDEKLQIPAGYSYQVAIAVGYPATVKQPHDIDKENKVSYII